MKKLLKKRIVSWLLAIAMVVTTVAVAPATTVKAAAANELREGVNYIIVSKQSGKALTVESYVKAENARICQMPITNCESQVWTLNYDDNGYYQIVNKYSGKSLNVPYASKDAGVEIVQFGKGNADNEKWQITDAGDGYCRITPKLVPQFGLNIEGASGDDGALLIQWNYAGADNEKWEFRPVQQINANPVWNEKADARVAIDSYLDKFFYVENGVGKLRNEPENGFWTDAEILEVFLDAYEHLGDEKYLTAAEQFFDGIIERRGTNWAWNTYNDDVLWMSLASVRLYLHTGNQKHLRAATENFNLAYDRAWSNDLGGGLWWTTGKQTKNACVNTPGALAAASLGAATGDKSYYDKAIAIWNWEYDVMYNPSNGEIADNITADGKYNYWANTGNQGSFAGLSAMLYQYTGEQKYLEVAEKAADLTATMGDGAEGYINREANSGDSIGGKGLLGRWLGYYTEVADEDKYDDWMMRNATAAWYNRNSDNLMWGAFGRKTIENLENSNKVFQPDNQNVTISNYAAWGCASAVAWILNCTQIDPVVIPGSNLGDVDNNPVVNQTVFEMEDGALSGGAAIVNAEGCSNGKYVGNVGGPNGGSADFHVVGNANGKATLRISYATYTARDLNVVVNGKSYALNCAGTGGWGTVGNPVEVEVELRAGNNTVQFTGVNGAYAPNLDKFEVVLPMESYPFEVEGGNLTGGAQAVNADVSGGQYVGNVGGGNNGTAALNVVSPAAGTYKMRVYYATLQERQLKVIVNGNAQDVNCVGTGSWSAVGAPVEVEVNLKSGNNTIQFTGVNGGYAPNLDKIEVDMPAYGSYEAESGILSGGAAVNDAADSSAGRYVGNVGGPNAGKTTLTVVSSTTGKKVVRIYYATYEARQLAVVANGTTYQVNCGSTGSWTAVGEPVEVEVELKAGNNTIALTGVNNAYAPNIDRIELN